MVQRAWALERQSLAARLARCSCRPRASERQRGLLAFGFGWIHGLGVAGGLGPLHLPAASLALALLSFSLGLEAAQIAIALAASPIPTFCARRQPSRTECCPCYPAASLCLPCRGSRGCTAPCRHTGRHRTVHARDPLCRLALSCLPFSCCRIRQPPTSPVARAGLESDSRTRRRAPTTWSRWLPLACGRPTR